MTRYMQDPEGKFERNYNQTSFMFAHALAGNPLFELDSLIDLARRMPNHEDTYWSNGKVKINNPWDEGTTGRVPLVETIRNIQFNDSIVILKHTEQDPVHGPVLQDFLTQLVELSGEKMRSDVAIGEALILISSPNRITPYHMDGETNFLAQLTGSKTFYVFPHGDSSLVPNDELERFFVKDQSSAIYKGHRQGDAIAYDLHAGSGIHIPPTSPHWVQNADNVSVAISFNFELRSVWRLAKIHSLNSRIRRLGIRPTPPGISQWRDSLKAMTATRLTALRAAAAPPPKPRPYPAWAPPNS